MPCVLELRQSRKGHEFPNLLFSEPFTQKSNLCWQVSRCDNGTHQTGTSKQLQIVVIFWFCSVTHDPEYFKLLIYRELTPVSWTVVDTSSVKWEIAVSSCAVISRDKQRCGITTECCETGFDSQSKYLASTQANSSQLPMKFPLLELQAFCSFGN